MCGSLWKKRTLMSEENAQTQAETPASTLTEGDIAALETLSLISPEVLEDPVIKTAIEKNNKEAAEEEKEKNPDAKAEDKTEGKKEEKTEDKIKEEEEVKSVFFSEEKGTVPTFKDETELAKYITEKYGQKIENPETLGKFFQTTVDKWRNDSQELRKSEGILDGYQKLFNQLPEPMREAIEEWGNAGDWQQKLLSSLPKFDYSKNFDKHNAVDMLTKYFPGKFEADEIEDIENNPTVEKALEVAKEKYNLEKQSFENRRAEIERQANEKVDLIKRSVNSSVDKLKEVFPDMDRKAIKEIESVMVGGTVGDLLFNKDGTYKSDAAKKIAFILYGDNEIKKREAKAKVSATNDSLQDVISRGSDKPRFGKGQMAVPSNEQADFITRTFAKKNTY